MSGMFPVASFPCICYRTEDYHCVSVSRLFGSPLSRSIFVYEWPRLSVALTVRALYGQGPDWQSCHPASFLSKKFSSAAQNYRTHEHEMIAILEALIKWEDELLG